MYSPITECFPIREDSKYNPFSKQRTFQEPSRYWGSRQLKVIRFFLLLNNRSELWFIKITLVGLMTHWKYESQEIKTFVYPKLSIINSRWIVLRLAIHIKTCSLSWALSRTDWTLSRLFFNIGSLMTFCLYIEFITTSMAYFWDTLNWTKPKYQNINSIFEISTAIIFMCLARSIMVPWKTLWRLQHCLDVPPHLVHVVFKIHHVHQPNYRSYSYQRPLNKVIYILP